MFSLRLAASTLFAGMFASPAAAQSALQVHDAELAVPFGSAEGLLVLAGDQIVFVSPDNPDMSVAIGRADVKSADRSGDVVTVSTHGSCATSPARAAPSASASPSRRA